MKESLSLRKTASQSCRITILSGLIPHSCSFSFLPLLDTACRSQLTLLSPSWHLATTRTGRSSSSRSGSPSPTRGRRLSWTARPAWPPFPTCSSQSVCRPLICCALGWRASRNAPKPPLLRSSHPWYLPKSRHRRVLFLDIEKSSVFSIVTETELHLVGVGAAVSYFQSSSNVPLANLQTSLHPGFHHP